LFPAGTDLQVQVVRPSALKYKDTWSGWPRMSMDPQLQQIVKKAPLRTHTPKNTPSDMTNLLFIGSRDELISAFSEAHWIEADDLGVKSALKVAQATMRQTNVESGPVSTLLINGKNPDLVFLKSLDTFAKRHHIR